MNKDELIQIAIAGFPTRILKYIYFDDCEIHSMSGVYRLYDKDEEFLFMLPKKDHLSIFIGANNFIQINPGIKAFNHYAAIEKMKELGLIKP